MGKFISKEFGGPTFLPRYRLAPQNPFPAALVDALLSYLYLLYPPPNSLHTAYTPEQIILGGDSAGGGLALCLIQFLLWLNKPNDDGSRKTLRWRGEEREVRLPRGVTIMSGWVELARCLPSESGSSGDYLPTPERTKSGYRQSESWPAESPRSHLYVDDTAITHPLVSPLMSPTWAGCPPVWLCVGDECLRDSNYYLAHRLLESSVPLHFEKYTAMPHVFPIVVQHHPCSRKSFQSVGRFIKHLLETEASASAGHASGLYKIVKIHPKTLAEEDMDVGELAMNGLTIGRLRETMENVVGKWERKRREATAML